MHARRSTSLKLAGYFERGNEPSVFIKYAERSRG